MNQTEQNGRYMKTVIWASGSKGGSWMFWRTFFCCVPKSLWNHQKSKVSMVFQAKIPPPLVSDLSITRGGIFASDQKIPTCAKNTVFFGAPAAHFPLYFAYFRAFRSPFDILYRKCSSMKILSTEIQHEICFANSRRRLYHCKNPVSHDVSGQGGCISLYFCHW